MAWAIGTPQFGGAVKNVSAAEMATPSPLRKRCLAPSPCAFTHFSVVLPGNCAMPFNVFRLLLIDMREAIASPGLRVQ